MKLSIPNSPSATLGAQAKGGTSALLLARIMMRGRGSIAAPPAASHFWGQLEEALRGGGPTRGGVKTLNPLNS